jgi:amidase
MAAYAASSKWRSEQQAAGAQNFAAADVQDLRSTEGIDRVKMHTMFRYALMKVMRENRIDVLVHPNVGLPLGRIGHAQEPNADGRSASGFGITDLLGVPEIIVPAGFNDVVYDPQFVLSEDKKSYTSVTGTTASTAPQPLPFSIQFWGAPGDEPVILKVASAYETVTQHRKPPAAFPALAPSTDTRISRARR